jgi:hypothetical protein
MKGTRLAPPPTPALAGEARGRAAGAATPLHRERRIDAGVDAADIVEIWGLDSFPASDAPANW